MAVLSAGTPVVLKPGMADKLVSPPPSSSRLYIAAHPGALKGRSTQTQAIAVQGDDPTWVGALDERMLGAAVDSPPRIDARALIRASLLRGARLWDIWRPGLLTRQGVGAPLFTVYNGNPRRPWVVLGELPNGCILAAPLNGLAAWERPPFWFTPKIRQDQLTFEGCESDSIVELAHIWSWGRVETRAGCVAEAARAELAEVVDRYFAQATSCTPVHSRR